MYRAAWKHSVSLSSQNGHFVQGKCFLNSTQINFQEETLLWQSGHVHVCLLQTSETKRRLTQDGVALMIQLK